MPDAPAWLQARLASYATAAPGSAARALWQFEQNGKTFYYEVAACCDQFNVLLDAKGNTLCAPDGGFTGRGDGRCDELKRPADAEMRLLWQAPKQGR